MVSSCGQRRLWSDWADADSEDSDQTGRTLILLVLSCRGSFVICLNIPIIAVYISIKSAGSFFSTNCTCVIKKLENWTQFTPDKIRSVQSFLLLFVFTHFIKVYIWYLYMLSAVYLIFRVDPEILHSINEEVNKISWFDRGHFICTNLNKVIHICTLQTNW